MIVKALTGLVATAVALAFFAVPVLKLKDPALVGVIAIGVLLMVIDLVEKLRSKDDS
ncbi:MAG: hypothetical protein KDG52_07265 [Rhodocyclaceae bacterium]|nr:hypothetical protein [Rhodocyclaceae bacterium]